MSEPISMQENGNVLIGLGQSDATLSNLTFPRTYGLHSEMVDTQTEIKKAFRKDKGANRCWLGDRQIHCRHFDQSHQKEWQKS